MAKEKAASIPIWSEPFSAFCLVHRQIHTNNQFAYKSVHNIFAKQRKSQNAVIYPNLTYMLLFLF